MQARDRAKGFWRWAFQGESWERLGDRCGEFLSILTRLVDFEHLDEGVTAQIKSIASFVEGDSHFLFEYLNRYEDRADLKHAGDILLCVIQKFVPRFGKRKSETLLISCTLQT